jgi:hypothetical protein
LVFTTKAFWCQKDGNSPHEYEDAFGFNDNLKEDGSYLRFAVADGASESSFCDHWANLLVNAFINGDFDSSDLVCVLEKLRVEWLGHIERKDLAWWAQEKVLTGAFSTLCGLSIKIEDLLCADGSFSVRAIGDSCFFHLRKERILQSFPMSSHDCFNISPELLGSNLASNEGLSFKEFSGSWLRGDHFLLLTDALAHWLLKSEAVGLPQVSFLLSLNSNEEFSAFIAQERSNVYQKGQSLLPNDDVTMVRIAVV